ncbi:hypothetical protein Z051_14765 [Rhodococcus rhodochrous KG-21]|uniref:Uncharacterized protein n=1 Tax=Rhodococcus rhodochrous KG-21 TaxID=1441923 RepID=A0A0M9WNE1_RHORH|nr:hypothetical protein [Rhodococcus rhodochrous]KOS55471.1 hypothetical protein Z051_14765 [Rhodococcus rhodochrous KG-21]
MTDGNSTDTGQISVAELLARNGQKVNSRAGGRRRRGVSGGISVAELTGEIPVTVPESAQTSKAGVPETEDSETAAPETAVPETAVSEAEAEAEDSGAGVPEAAPVVSAPPKAQTPEPLKAQTPEPSKAQTPEPSKAQTPEPSKAQTPEPPKAQTPVAAEADRRETRRPEAESPGPETPVPTSPHRTREESAAEPVPPVKVESPTEIIRPAVLPRRARAHAEVAANAPARPVDTPEPRLLSGPASDLRGSSDDTADGETETIGKAVAAGEQDAEQREKPASRRGAAASAETPAAAEAPSDTGKSRGAIAQWAWLIGEGIVAIVAGALLFKGFEQLWDVLPWVAFALALLVIVGLVAMVRILRRTDDIASQLIALAVGAFVTFGPLLFLLPTG